MTEKDRKYLKKAQEILSSERICGFCGETRHRIFGDCCSEECRLAKKLRNRDHRREIIRKLVNFVRHRIVGVYDAN